MSCHYPAAHRPSSSRVFVLPGLILETEMSASTILVDLSFFAEDRSSPDQIPLPPIWSAAGRAFSRLLFLVLAPRNDPAGAVSLGRTAILYSALAVYSLFLESMPVVLGQVLLCSHFAFFVSVLFRSKASAGEMRLIFHHRSASCLLHLLLLLLLVPFLLSWGC